jgi:hypothetical protein
MEMNLMNKTEEEVASEISQRISLLNALSEADLQNEMRELKTALKENPTACALMMDEDIGLLVQALRKLTHKAITAAPVRKTAAAKAPVAKKLTAAELAAALDDEDF